MIQKLLGNRSLTRDLIGLALTGLGAITLLTLLSINAGGLVSMWANFLRGVVFGLGAFLFAIALIVIGIVLLMNASLKPSASLLKQIIGGELAFVALLALLHTLFSGANEAAYARSGNGGGAVGWVVSQGLLSLLGSAAGLSKIFAIGIWLVLLVIGARWLFAPVLGASWLARLRTKRAPPKPAAKAAVARPAPKAAPEPAATPIASSKPVQAATPARVAPEPSVQLTPHVERSVIQGETAKPTSKPPAKANAKQAKLAVSHELPPLTLLKIASKPSGKAGEADVQRRADEIETTLSHFGLVGKVVEIRRGPTVTQFGVEPGYLDRGSQNRDKVLQRLRATLNDALAESIVVEGSVDRASILVEAPAPIADSREYRLMSLMKSALADTEAKVTIEEHDRRSGRVWFEASVDETKKARFKANQIRDLQRALVDELSARMFEFDDFAESDMLNERLNIAFPKGMADALSVQQNLEAQMLDMGLAGSVKVDKRKSVATLEWQKQAQKVRVGQIAALKDDLALALSATSLRIEAPIPGRGLVGIEVPNDNVSIVDLRSVIESEQFKSIAEKSLLAFAIGSDVSGTSHSADLARMPHLLIAGTTGSGKSVMISGIITCLAIRNRPENLKMVMIDPKMVELTRFAGLPHILGKPESDIERIPAVLRWVTREMDSRYKKFAEAAARNLSDYNGQRAAEDRLPHIVVFIDELADLMLQSPIETEKTICRLAQMARATGIHLVVATQRPSVDVVTGLIKANFPARMSFAVASSTDSRVILDQVGADSLLGRGDMLFLHPEVGSPMRLQGCMVSDKEVQSLVAWWVKQAAAEAEAAGLVEAESDEAPDEFVANMKPKFDTPWDMVVAEMATERATSSSGRGRASNGDGIADEDGDDELIKRAMDIIQTSGSVSTSLLQRKLRIGYPRAARLMEELKEMGYVGDAPRQAGKGRDVLQRAADDVDAVPEMD